MTISAIIPVFNGAETLIRCVESIINQSFPVREIIIVNNNSTDNTAEIILQLQNKYPQIISLFETQPGANAARNAGLKKATGSWIQFLDADDIILPDKLNHQIKLISSLENPGVIIAPFQVNYYKINGQENTYKKSIADDLINGFIKYELGGIHANLWNKSAIYEVGLFNETLTATQEYELLWRIYLHGYNLIMDHKIYAIAYQYLQNESISRTQNAIRAQQILEHHLKYLQNIKAHLHSNNKKYYHPLIAKEMGRMYFFYRLRYPKDSYIQSLSKQYAISLDLMTKIKVIYTQIVLDHFIFSAPFKYFQLILIFVKRSYQLFVR